MRAVDGDLSMGMGPYEQFSQLAHELHGPIIRNCGHWIEEEQPGQVAEALGSFLR